MTYRLSLLGCATAVALGLSTAVAGAMPSSGQISGAGDAAIMLVRGGGGGGHGGGGGGGHGGFGGGGFGGGGHMGGGHVSGGGAHPNLGGFGFRHGHFGGHGFRHRHFRGGPFFGFLDDGYYDNCWYSRYRHRWVCPGY
jgi:hypothetical protein